MGSLRLEHEWNVLAIQGCSSLGLQQVILKEAGVDSALLWHFHHKAFSRLILELGYDSFYKHRKPQGTEMHIF